jgi:hypothetical protein
LERLGRTDARSKNEKKKKKKTTEKEEGDNTHTPPQRTILSSYGIIFNVNNRSK